MQLTQIRFQHSHFPRYSAALLLVAALLNTGSLSYAQPAAADTSKAPARSSLSQEALTKAREAEKLLAANQPDKAVEILKELDKSNPNQAAISRRLAEINDTRNNYGAALFYYRRYVKLAGDRVSPEASARITTLEVMVGVDAQADKYAKGLGEATIPVATPSTHVERSLQAEAKDGSRVALTNADQLEKIHKQGYVVPVKTPEVTVTPGPTPIVIPENLLQRPAAPATAAELSAPAEGASMPVSTIEGTGDQVRITSNRGSTKSAPSPAARKPDEDALLAQAFVKSDSEKDIAAKLAQPDSSTAPATSESGNTESAETPEILEPTPLKLQAQVELTPPKLSIPNENRATPKPRQAPATGQIAYTKETPSTNSPRADTFFTVSQTIGNYGMVSLRNDLKDAVVTVSVTPQDDRDALSAILVPGEAKSLRIAPGSYQVTANVSTTDYSPITLMNTQFDYTFSAGKQYTKRFTQNSLQQLN